MLSANPSNSVVVFLTSTFERESRLMIDSHWLVGRLTTRSFVTDLVIFHRLNRKIRILTIFVILTFVV